MEKEVQYENIINQINELSLPKESGGVQHLLFKSIAKS